MALNLVTSQGGTAASGLTATYTVTSTGTAAGTGLALIIAWRIAAAASQTITGVTDNKGNTWIKEFSDNDATSTVKADIWSVPPSTYISGVTTITVTFSIAASSAWYHYEVSGGDAVSADWGDQGIGGHGSSTAPTASSGTLGQADEFVMGGIAWGSNTVTVSGVTASWTQDTLETATSPNLRLQPAHQIVSATTALTLAGTLSASTRWSVLGVTFKAGTAGPLAASTTMAATGTLTMVPSVAVSATTTLSGSGALGMTDSVAVAETLTSAGVGALTPVAGVAVSEVLGLSGAGSLGLASSVLVAGGRCARTVPVLVGSATMTPAAVTVPVLVGSAQGC
jgi:hypothetical protein